MVGCLLSSYFTQYLLVLDNSILRKKKKVTFKPNRVCVNHVCVLYSVGLAPVLRRTSWALIIHLWKIQFGFYLFF